MGILSSLFLVVVSYLAILIEKMRREGYELQVSRPQVIFKEKDGGDDGAL